MANPIYITYTTTGTKTAIPLDYLPAPFNAAVQVQVGTTATYAMQYTFDDPASATALWTDDTVIPTGTTATAATSYTTPIRALRFVIAAVSGNLNVKILQGHPAS